VGRIIFRNFGYFLSFLLCWCPKTEPAHIGIEEKMVQKLCPKLNFRFLREIIISFYSGLIQLNIQNNFHSVQLYQINYRNNSFIQSIQMLLQYRFLDSNSSKIWFSLKHFVKSYKLTASTTTTRTPPVGQLASPPIFTLVFYILFCNFYGNTSLVDQLNLALAQSFRTWAVQACVSRQRSHIVFLIAGSKSLVPWCSGLLYSWTVIVALLLVTTE